MAKVLVLLLAVVALARRLATLAAAPAYVFSQNALYPVYDDRGAKLIPVNLAAGTYERGTILGQVTSAGANDVQTITYGGTVSGGTFSITATPTTPNAGQGSVTLVEPYNVTAAALQADLESIYGPGNVVVTGAAGSSAVVTFTGALALLPIPVMVITDNTTGSGHSVTLVHTTTGAAATGTYGAYASGNSDGTQLPKAILMYPCVVTNVGGVLQIVTANAGGSSEVPGGFELYAQAYFHGTFRTQELVGLDANAVTKLAGNIVQGTSAAGIFSF